MRDVEHVQRAAIDAGFMLTHEQASSLRFLPDDTSQRVASKLALIAQELRSPGDREARYLALGLSSTLTSQSYRRFLEELELFLLAQVGALRARDIRTEVLASWLAEIEPSDSSSGCADGESAGELPTPSRTDDALPLNHAASVTVFPSEEKGERS